MAKKKKGAVQMKSSAKVDLSDRLVHASHGTWEQILKDKPKDKKFWTFEDKFFNGDGTDKYLIWTGKEVLGPLTFEEFKQKAKEV